MKTLTIGGGTLDIFFLQDQQPFKHSMGHHEEYLMVPHGAKVVMDDAHIATGGGATNAAVILATLGITSDTCIKIGNDAIGTFIIEQLQAQDIGRQSIITTNETHSAVSCILPAQSGNRTILVYRGANAYFTPDDLPHDVESYDGVYMTSLAQQAAQYVAAISQLVRKHVPLLAHNPGNEELETYTDALCQALSYIDVFILNAREARQLLSRMSQDPDCLRRLCKGPQPQRDDDMPELLTHLETVEDTCLDIRTYMREIMHRGPDTVVVTNGAEGVYVGHKDTLYFGQAPSVDVTCSVGAGDACGSTLFGMLLQGHSAEKALSYAMHNSCHVLQALDANSGAASKEQLAEHETCSISRYKLYPNKESK